MKKILLSVSFSLLSAYSFASTECVNKAKYYAIQTYHAEMGTVQGSDGISYDAKLLNSAKKSILNYLVSIQDNNEDGETWVAEYKVIINNKNGDCQKKSVKQIMVRNL